MLFIEHKNIVMDFIELIVLEHDVSIYYSFCSSSKTHGRNFRFFEPLEYWMSVRSLFRV